MADAVVKNKKEKKQAKFKKANPIVWFIFSIFSYIFMRIKGRIKVDNKVLRKRNKKEGAIILFNHQTNHDHFICAANAGLQRLTYVVSHYYMRKKTTNFMLHLVRAISKVQFRTDLVSIRKMKRAIDHKGLVTIAPAGQISIHGELTYVDPSIVKLLKLCKVDVYAFQIMGGYLCLPKWRKNKKTRRSPIRVKTIKVLAKEELATLTDEEIFNKVLDAINISEHAIQKVEMKKINFKERIEGLENVLYVCPKCGKKYAHTSSLDTMTCKYCQNTIVMDEYGFIHGKTDNDICFENEAIWYDWQSEVIEKKFNEDDFYMENRFKLYRNLTNPKVMEEVGEGVLTMTKSALYYDGTSSGETIHKEFSFDILTQLPFSPGHHFEVPDGDGSFQFRPLDEPETVLEWVQTIDTINKIKRN